MEFFSFSTHFGIDFRLLMEYNKEKGGALMEQQEITKAFGANLRQLRKEAGLTQVQLAELLGYSSKAVSKWESGECIAPSALLPTISFHSCLSCHSVSFY